MGMDEGVNERVEMREKTLKWNHMGDKSELNVLILSSRTQAHFPVNGLRVVYFVVIIIKKWNEVQRDISDTSRCHTALTVLTAYTSRNYSS
jgi:hypothetical protein